MTADQDTSQRLDDERARDILVAAIERLNAEIAVIDAELQRLAGDTPAERRAFMRRTTRAIR